MSLQSVPTSPSPSILRDCDALVQIKVGSRSAYLRTFNMLREFVGDQLESRPPTEDEILQFLRHLREEKLMASSTMWSMYTVQYGELGFQIKQYCRVTALLNSYDTDIKQLIYISQIILTDL